MKKLFLLTAITSYTLLTPGCLSLQLGGGEKHEVNAPTIGQQLVDLQKAKDSGAITDTEFQVQKAKVLGGK